MDKTIFIGKKTCEISFLFAFTFGILKILIGLQVIPYPQDLYWLSLPSLFISPAILITTICIDILVRKELRKWTNSAWILATINCIVIIMFYFSQPGLLNPKNLTWSTEPLEKFLFEQPLIPRTIHYYYYILLSTSSLMLAFAFRKIKIKWLFPSLLLHGLFIPFLFLSYLFPQFYWVLFGWLMMLAIVIFNLIKFFKILERKIQESPKGKSEVYPWLIDL